MIVLTLTGWTGSPSVAMTVSTCPSTLNWAGHTVPKELISRNLYLLPGVIVNTSNGVLVTKPVLGSWKTDFVCTFFLQHTFFGVSLVPGHKIGEHRWRVIENWVSQIKTNLMQHCAVFISAGSLYMFRAQAPIIRSI